MYLLSCLSAFIFILDKSTEMTNRLQIRHTNSYMRNFVPGCCVNMW